MLLNEAIKAVQNEGFKNVKLIEQDGEDFAFECDNNGETVAVVVSDGEVVIAPTN